MNTIDVMVAEHKYILRMLKVIRSASFQILKGKEINYDDYGKIIDFIRNYADAHHHGKEEKFLFQEMLNNLGEIGKNLIAHGMLVEHDQGRLYIRDLELALERVKSGDEESKLDVIANGVGYASLLERHIKKEDTVVYTFAARKLSPEVLEHVDKLSEEFEKKEEQKGLQKKYINLLIELEDKYIGDGSWSVRDGS